MKVLSLIPPMTQLNTPYPSTAYLTGFLRSQGVDAVQADLALSLVLDLLTPDALRQVRDKALQLPLEDRSACVNFFLDHFTGMHVTIVGVRVSEVFGHVLWQQMTAVAGGVDQQIGRGRGNRAIQNRLECLVARLTFFKAEVIAIDDEFFCPVENELNNIG